MRFKPIELKNKAVYVCPFEAETVSESNPSQEHLIIIELSEKIEQFQQQNENLKCCGNCTKRQIEFTKPESYCKHWQSDRLTQEERK